MKRSESKGKTTTPLTLNLSHLVCRQVSILDGVLDPGNDLGLLVEVPRHLPLDQVTLSPFYRIDLSRVSPFPNRHSGLRRPTSHPTLTQAEKLGRKENETRVDPTLRDRVGSSECILVSETSTGRERVGTRVNWENG